MSTAVARRRTPTWLVSVVAGSFGLFYAYAVWSAVSYLVATAGELASVGASLSAVAWAVLGAAVFVPIAVFVLAVSVGRRRGLPTLVLLLLVGLALTAVFWLDAQAYTSGPAVFA